MRRIMLALCGLVILSPLLLFIPINYLPPDSPLPSQSYEESLARFAQIRANEADAPLFEGCESQLLHHNQPVEQVMVLFHGYRSCPLQMRALGEIFYAQGYNVLIPRAPDMGLADPLAPEQATLTADELSVYSTEAVDIAQGLGEQVTVIGFSMGGVVTAWQAQRRADVDRAVLISPAFDLKAVPAQLKTPVVRLFGLLPNQYLWQDAALQMEVPNPPQVYPRNATRSISAFLRYGTAVRSASQREKPAAAEMLIIFNDADGVVINETTATITEAWRSQGYTTLETYHFASDLHLDHDLIDPVHPNQQIEKVYPILIEQMRDE